MSSVPDQKTLDLLKDKIRGDPRISLSRKLMLQDILNKTQFKEWIPPGNRLWDYTDSVLQNKKPAVNTGISEQSVLFQFAYKKYLAGDWILYRKNLKSAPNLTNGKTDTEIFDIYRETMAFDYYREHLEEYNPAFAAQVKEFRDGNLLFEVMQRKIWNPAAADSAGLKKYFEAHAASYWWKPGAEAIIFTTTGTASSKQLKKYLVSNIKNWRKIVDSAGGQTQADSGRFEMNQIPGHTRFEAGHFTGEVINPDHTVQFAYILHNYAGSSPRSFEEARGLVINDYQNQLEDEWIQELKKKYPVIVNEVVFSSLPK